MTATLAAGHLDRRSDLARAPAQLVAPVVVALGVTVTFLAVSPNVVDLEAALARQSGAEHGVGLGYWFAWFSGGTTPAVYSLITPTLSAWFGAQLLAAVATFALTPIAWWGFAGSRYRLWGVWVATIVAGGNLWSGRVPFSLACVAGALCCIGVYRRTWMLAVPAAFIGSVITPVTGAFLIFAMVAVFATDRSRRALAVAVAIAGGVVLVGVAAYFGVPGPEPYSLGKSLKAGAAAAIMLAARPPRPVWVVLAVSVIASPILTTFDNGLGANFIRLPYICLPAIVVATARSRRAVALLAVVPAVAGCLQITVQDLLVAGRPAASTGYYAGLSHELPRLPGLARYRLEVVQDPDFHTATTVLVNRVAFARGWETQPARRFEHVLTAPGLTAGDYRRWLAQNAVGYVALDRRTRASTPEYHLLADHRPRYLVPLWRDRTWTLYRVRRPTPIVAPPGRLLRATQASLTVSVPCACTVALRLRYSTFLGAGQARIIDRDGWAVLITPAPGRFVLAGELG